MFNLETQRIIVLIFGLWSFVGVCLLRLQTSTISSSSSRKEVKPKSLLLHSNKAMLLIPSYAALQPRLHLCACLYSLWIAVYSALNTPQPSLSLLLPMVFWWTPSPSPLFTLTSVPLSVNPQLSPYWLEMVRWSNGRPSNWLESSGRKEGIDLSVVLGDQLIPIVCASTDSPMCLICYGLFLLGQDKSLSHPFPLWTTNQIKSKGMTACRGFLPRLWLADHNKERPSIWKAE